MLTAIASEVIRKDLAIQLAKPIASKVLAAGTILLGLALVNLSGGLSAAVVYRTPAPIATLAHATCRHSHFFFPTSNFLPLPLPTCHHAKHSRLPEKI